MLYCLFLFLSLLFLRINFLYTRSLIHLLLQLLLAIFQLQIRIILRSLICSYLWRLNRYFSFETVTKCIVINVFISWIGFFLILNCTSLTWFIIWRSVTFKLGLCTIWIIDRVNGIWLVSWIHVVWILILVLRICWSVHRVDILLWCETCIFVSGIHLHLNAWTI